MPPSSDTSLPHDAPLSEADPNNAIGKGTDLGEGQILLPPFVSTSAGGICVDARSAGSATVITQFIERVFSSGAYFVDIDYATLSTLIYPRTAAGDTPPPWPGEAQRIAGAIRRFDPVRQAIYKNVKVTDGAAEYIFEPVAIERMVEKPIFGETDANGQPVQTGTEQSVVMEPTKLNVDEFVAAMWQKEVRHGLDIPAIRDALKASGAQRIVIARRTEPEPGLDATLAEQTKALHRDDSPHILPNGKVDLNQFKNRFPQITAGEALLKKIPRRFGKLGFDLDGSPIEPPIPRDFDINELAGAGTRVERKADGEYVFSASDGFLNIDVASHQISVTSKIINKEGVSLRTTGNLSLTGSEFEEHGEVQERRVVEGKNMTFHAHVFGEIVSHGGHVHLIAGLAGGSVRSPGGSVQIDARAAQAVVDARGGEVTIAQAENSAIFADKVHIARALGCEIIADDVEIEEALACTVVGRRVRITKAGARRNMDTLVSLCVPDFGDLDKKIGELRKEMRELEDELRLLQKNMETMSFSPELRKFLAVESSVRAGTVKLSDAQMAQLRAAAQKLARPLQQLREARAVIDREQGKHQALNDQLGELKRERDAAAVDIRCDITAIEGDVAVRTVRTPPNGRLYPNLTAEDAKHKLRDGRDTAQRLFSADAGSFSWQFAEQEAPDEAAG